MDNTKQAKIAFSDNQDIAQALNEIKTQLGEENYSLILFFASPYYEPQKISTGFKDTFPSSMTMGCTTAGELFEGKLLKNSIVAMAFDEKIIKSFHYQIVDDMNEPIKVNKALQEFSKKLGVPLSEIDPEKHVGILITDGLKGSPENIISRISEMTEVFFIGGAAGDNWELKHTYIYVDGQYYENIALMILLEPTNGFKVVKTQSFEPLSQVFSVTGVDEAKRCIKTIDNRPAAKVFAEQVGLTLEELKAQIDRYTLGQMIYNEAYIHDPMKIDNDNNLYLFSAVPLHAEIRFFKPSNIIKDTREFVEKEIRQLKNISAIIHFNCATRDTRIRKENLEKEFEEIFEGFPLIGFATYGEFFISFLNLTSTILILF